MDSTLGSPMMALLPLAVTVGCGYYYLNPHDYALSSPLSLIGDYMPDRMVNTLALIGGECYRYAWSCAAFR